MEGGRFLGVGSYGCVFTPPLLCEGDKGHKPKYGMVGKLTLDILADQEIRVADRIRKVPMSKHYFLLPEPESCQPAPEEEQKDPSIEECEIGVSKYTRVKFKDLEQIFEPFGGNKNLFYFMDSKGIYSKQFSFVKTMRHLLEAGSILAIAGVCHFDLHPGNFMLDKNLTFRIIDYGNAVVMNEMTESGVNMRWKRVRFGFESDAAHPAIVNSDSPEYTVMNAIKSDEFSIENACKLTVFGKPVFKDMQKYLGVSMEYSREELIEFCKTSDSMRQYNFLKVWKTYWPGFDSWSLAVILFEMFKALLYHKAFLDGEYKTKKASILATLKGMLEPNPRNRLDCIEALALFDPGNPWLQRFGQKWLQARRQQRQK